MNTGIYPSLHCLNSGQDHIQEAIRLHEAGGME